MGAVEDAAGPGFGGGPRGHGLVAHGRERVIEAWGPTPLACIEEAVVGLSEVFTDPAEAPTIEPVPVQALRDSPSEQLLGILEEALSVVDVMRLVPVDARLSDTEDGGVAGYLDCARAVDLEITGAVPTGVSRSGLRLARGDGGWAARATVDLP